jgi:hypothetical protein
VHECYKRRAMKPWSLMLVAAGIAGVFGLFLPLVEVKHRAIVVSYSAKQLSFGMDNAHKLLDSYEAAQGVLDKRAPRLGKKIPGDLRYGEQDARMVADASRGAALAFAPAAILLVLGAIGLVRKQLGRISGGLALLLGLSSIGAWIGLKMVLDYALEEVALKRTTVAMQIGAHMLLVIGALGAIAGIGALVKPMARRS